jgi:hypothetical protein
MITLDLILEKIFYWFTDKRYFFIYLTLSSLSSIIVLGFIFLPRKLYVTPVILYSIVTAILIYNTVRNFRLWKFKKQKND